MERSSTDDILQADLQLLGPVAQLVEHRTFNAVVAGSSPARLTNVFGVTIPCAAYVPARALLTVATRIDFARPNNFKILI